MRVDEIAAVMHSVGKIHFVGIGGVSMSSLAAITKMQGYEVSGSDRADGPAIERLRHMGITVTIGHDRKNVQGASLVVHTAAVKKGNPELDAAEENGVFLCSRADYLGYLMSFYDVRIGVAGTHGKSTVTSMLAEIFMAADRDPTVVSGAILPSMGGAYRLGSRHDFIFEACEYCDSFLSFLPTTAVVTNLEYDHPDYFRSMDQLRRSFDRYLGLAQCAILNADDPESLGLAERTTIPVTTFGFSENADVRAENLSYENGCCRFSLEVNGKIAGTVALSVPGEHNVMDALAASAAAYRNGVPTEAIAKGLARFTGAERRFTYMGKTSNGADVYNDYAHHPSELRATLQASKSFGKRVVAVFQPHTYSRTAGLFEDFCRVLSLADRLILADIYAARESNTFGVSSADIAARVPGAVYIDSFDGICRELLLTTGEGDMILILGAGDIVNIGAKLLR